MNKLLILAILVSLAVVVGCAGDTPVIEEPAEKSPLDDLVIANAYAVQAAAEAFAAENYGFYPYSIIDRSPGGNSIIDLLPQGILLENPYTNQLTVPIQGMAFYPGEVGYTPYCGRWSTLGYLITGAGVNGEVISLSPLPRDLFYFDDQTVANCLTLQTALEAYAADNNGQYPSNIDVNTSLVGKTVIDYLPGGTLMVNPYTLVRTEPVNGVAVIPGQTGYVPVIVGGQYYYSYVITGYGLCADIITLRPGWPEDEAVKGGCYKLMAAVEDFAAENNGVYPDDVDADMTPSGNTVIDLLRGGRLLENAYKPTSVRSRGTA